MTYNIDDTRRVLMMPLRRCGSHALRLRLNQSSEFYAPYPIHIVDFMPMLSLYGDLENDNNYFQLINDIVGLQSGLMIKWSCLSIDPVEIFDAIKNKPRSIHSIVWALLLVAGKQHNASVVMDKSLDSVLYAEELIALFPNMLFLNVVRDPRAQISSMNKAIIYDYDTLLNTQTWVKHYHKSRILSERYPDNVLTVRFEDFIANEARVIEKICHFFKIPFTDAMLDVSSSEEAQSISTRSALWTYNVSSPVAANVDKFKKTLSADEISIIETLTSQQMEYYGYERMTKGTMNITAELNANALRHSEENKAKAWRSLKLNNPRDYMQRRYRLDYINMLKSRLLNDNEDFYKQA